jgi:hypothetical protein
MDLFALATLPAAADEAGGPPSIKFYELRDNLQKAGRPCEAGVQRRCVALILKRRDANPLPD